METLQALTNFYSNYDEEGRLLSKHGQVEYLTTMRYIDKYLQPGMRVLEIGAATGRYSHALARQGYQVDAVELIQHNIDIFNTLTQPEENVTIRQGNAMDLSCFADDTFDITLLLGPMYHLFTVEDQLQALKEAIRVTKKGGILFVAYCGNDATMVQYCLGRGMLKEEKYQKQKEKLKIKAENSSLGIASLSGGNQQKVFLARWLNTGAEVLLFDNPTQGVDVGAKSEIYRLILEFAKQGQTVIINTLEIPEVQKVADRCVVFYEGEIAAILDHKDVTEQVVMAYSTGAKRG